MTWAACDPGASQNAAAVVGLAVSPGGIWAPVYLWEQSGTRGHPLDLRRILVPHARAVRELGAASWMTDAFALHDATHAGWEGGIATVVEGGEMLERWRDLLAIIARSQLSLAPHPRLTREQWPLLEVLGEQLATVREVSRGGRRTIEIPTVGASHGDLASAFARAFHHAKAADYVLDDLPRPIPSADDGMQYADLTWYRG